MKLTIESRPLSRRSFLVTAGSFGAIVAFGGRPTEVGAASFTDPVGQFRPNAFVTIGADGMVTVVCPASEMGQGAMTVLPLLIAEDMDADWNDVRIVQAPANQEVYGNPGRGGRQLTGGSETVWGYYEMMRLVGAQTKMALLMSAADLWTVPRTELTSSPGCVNHEATGRSLSFGEIAALGSIPHHVPTVELADLKPLSDCRYIGRTDMDRVDIPGKVDGSAIFGLDVRLPGMLYGAILRAPVGGEAPESIDSDAASAVSGVVRIVRLEHGVGVIAETVEAAMRAKELLNATWTTSSQLREYSSDAALMQYRDIGRDLSQIGVSETVGADVSDAFAGAATILEFDYLNEHVYHATMEPMTATALVHGDQVEVWAPTQGPAASQIFAARAAGTAPENVKVNTTLIGGGFGRKAEGDFIADAVLLAREVQGRPVKMTWSREDDVRHCQYRPLTAQHVRVGLDDAGHILGWQHRIVGESVFARTVPAVLEAAGGMDSVLIEGAHLNYAVPAHQIDYVRQDSGQPVGFWRGVGVGYTRFCVESVLDEIAAATGRDPLEYRLELLVHEPRARRVLQTVARMAEWGREREGRALGIAYSDMWAHCAQIAEVSLDRDSGVITLHSVWCAVDAGVAVQPRNIEAQIMGGIIHGASHALFEEISIVDGEVQQSNFHDYRVMRVSEAPQVHVEILEAAESGPAGIGEVGLPPVAPAIANAVARLTGGRRLRHLPFSPDRVRSAISA